MWDNALESEISFKLINMAIVEQIMKVSICHNLTDKKRTQVKINPKIYYLFLNLQIRSK